jgi:hypothetical protein
MPFTTDERLKGYLDTNQLSREQLCRAILAVDRRFSEVRPRQPRGGRDGGRDIEALYKQEQIIFGAVGFVNQANDSKQQKKQISKKFKDDAKSALRSEQKPDVFVFLTNVNFTTREKDDLIDFARKEGFKFCEVMDRERLRIALDSPDGFAIRFQFLGLPLSEAEQASFFAKWGDDINSVVSTGFQRLEQKLDRILFLHEALDPLHSFAFFLQLKRVYQAAEIGHFRAFTYIFLKEPKLDIFRMLFGSCDRSKRVGANSIQLVQQEPSGIQYGISGGQWHSFLKVPDQEATQAGKGQHETEARKFHIVGSSSGVGMNSAEFIPIRYNNDVFLRLAPTLRLADLSESSFLTFLNSSLASKLQAIHIYANGYKIQELTESDFKVDDSAFDLQVPVQFTNEELADPWVSVRPSGFSSAFKISFSSCTPKRVFDSPTASDSLGNRRRKGDVD